MCCPAAIWGFARQFARRTVWPTCRSPPRSKPLGEAGIPTAPWPPGISGAAWSPTPICNFLVGQTSRSARVLQDPLSARAKRPPLFPFPLLPAPPGRSPPAPRQPLPPHVLRIAGQIHGHAAHLGVILDESGHDALGRGPQFELACARLQAQSRAQPSQVDFGAHGVAEPGGLLEQLRRVRTLPEILRVDRGSLRPRALGIPQFRVAALLVAALLPRFHALQIAFEIVEEAHACLSVAY